MSKDIQISFLVSFPRSGSNFVQNVLRQSRVCEAVSLYKSDLADDWSGNLKSHAPTPAYLRDEIRRHFGPGRHRAAEMIWLHRDPRDVMISFYEYTCHRLNTTIDQAVFARRFDFFLAAPIDRQCARLVEIERIDVIHSYRKHLRQWWRFCNRGRALAVKYEDLLVDPEAEFSRIFTHLGAVDKTPVIDAGEKVSLHSQEDRQRAQAYSWRSVQAEYSEIINLASSVLADEIRMCGYDQT